MTKIILTPDQVKVYSQATEPIAVCDSHGRFLGTLPPPAEYVQACDGQTKVVDPLGAEYSAEFIAELKRRAKAPGRRFTSEQVTRHMQALAKVWEQEGPFDRKRLMEILEQLRAEDAA